jgi:hypothetical protein
MLPWIMNPSMKRLKEEIVEKIVSEVRKYHTFLTGMKKRAVSNHEKLEPVRGFHDNWMLDTKEAGNSVAVEYRAIDRALNECENYQMIDLVDFEPSEKEDRRKWYKHLCVSCSVCIYSYKYGNYLGNINMIWKIPAKAIDRKSSENVRIINLVRDSVMTFSTRRMRRDFVNKYTKKIKIQPVILRNIYQFLTNFEYSPNSEKEAAIDDRLMQYLVESEDCELLFDLRKDNGRPCDSKYEPFWDALGKHLEENTAVHERRQTNIQYLPFAISVEDLRANVIKKLPQGTPFPSVSWLRLNFQPRNPYMNSASNYTGKFNVKYAVQQRLLRVKHVESSFCRQQFLL